MYKNSTLTILIFCKYERTIIYNSTIKYHLLTLVSIFGIKICSIEVYTPIKVEKGREVTHEFLIGRWIMYLQ